MTKRLKNLTVREVSLVDKGANNKRFLLTKRADGTEVEMDEKQVQEQIEKALAEKVEKAVAEAVAKAEAKAAEALAKLEAEKTEQIAKALADKADLEKRLADEQEAKALAEEVQKAANSYKHVPEKAEVIAKDLLSLRRFNPELCGRVETLLKKFDAVSAQLLEPKGSAKSEDVSTSAWDEIQKRAEKKTGMTKAAAIDQVLTESPELYQQYLSEQKG